jgi:hypothetical protein
VTQGRLNTSVEVTGLLRKAESAGDFGVVLRRGDPERGSLLIVVRSRGGYVSCLERTLSLDGRYSWGKVGPENPPDDREVAEFLDRRTRFDPDLWLIELDVAQPERFIAETTSAG